MRKLLEDTLGDNPGGTGTPASEGQSPTPDLGVNRPSAVADLRGRAIRLAGQVVAIAERFAAIADESADLADAAVNEANTEAEPRAFCARLGQVRALATFAEEVHGYFNGRDDQLDIVVGNSLLVMACGASGGPPSAAVVSPKGGDTDPTADSVETTDFYVYHCSHGEQPGRRPTLRVFDAEVKRSNEHAFSDYEDYCKLGTVELPADALSFEVEAAALARFAGSFSPRPVRAEYQPRCRWTEVVGLVATALHGRLAQDRPSVAELAEMLGLHPADVRDAIRKLDAIAREAAASRAPLQVAG